LVRNKVNVLPAKIIDYLFKSDGLVIGVDVGGTKVAAGLVNPEGEITEQIRAPMAPIRRLPGRGSLYTAARRHYREGES
jgi:N-acetylglucosamine kinase-like BadF-type ATPase